LHFPENGFIFLSHYAKRVLRLSIYGGVTLLLGGVMGMLHPRRRRLERLFHENTAGVEGFCFFVFFP